MAPQLIARGCDFKHLFCSAAVRAQSTISLIDQALPADDIHWKVEEALYIFDYQQLLLWLRALNNDVDSVTIIGHNPALTDLINHLSIAKVKNLPTCAYAQLNKMHLHDWQSLKAEIFQLDCFITPKTVISQA